MRTGAWVWSERAERKIVLDLDWPTFRDVCDYGPEAILIVDRRAWARWAGIATNWFLSEVERDVTLQA
jgi:hypothetical protein